MSLPIFTICVPCGALIHDQAVHAAFHAALDTSAQAMQQMVARGMAVLHELAPDRTPPPGDDGPVGPISGRDHELPPAAADPATTRGATP